jgi:hypothetical protein
MMYDRGKVDHRGDDPATVPGMPTRHWGARGVRWAAFFKREGAGWEEDEEGWSRCEICSSAPAVQHTTYGEANMRLGATLILAGVAAAAACATAPIYEPREWNATVEPRDDSGVRATARAATGPGQTAVAISLAGGTAGGTHPWHIHRGTCDTGGPIVGDADAYPALRPTSAGGATATAHIRVQLVPDEDYHINVHRSPQALGEVLACGNLR